MARKQDNQNQKSLVVNMRYVATPDAEERLCRAMDILLRAATRDTSQAEDSPNADKEKPSTRGTHEAAADNQTEKPQNIEEKGQSGEARLIYLTSL